MHSNKYAYKHKPVLSLIRQGTLHLTHQFTHQLWKNMIQTSLTHYVIEVICGEVLPVSKGSILHHGTVSCQIILVNGIIYAF